MEYNISQEGKLKIKRIIGFLFLFGFTAIIFAKLICKEKTNVSKEWQEFAPDSIKDERIEQIKSLKKLLDLDPSDHNTYYEIGRLYNKLGDHENAYQYLKKADSIARKKNIDPSMKYNILTELAHSLSKRGKFDEAIKILERAKKISPKKVTAYNRRGNIHDKRREIRKARKEYLKAQSVNKKHPDSYRNLANQELLKGNYDSALDYLKESVRKNPNNYTTFKIWGMPIVS